MISKTDIFYGTSGPRDADIVVVGESWGKEEELKRKPFVGQSGHELTKILAECGIPRNKVFFTNVVPERPLNNDMLMFFHTTQTARQEHQPLIRGLYPKENVINGLATLRDQLRIVNPKIVIGFGNYTLWALTDDCFKVDDKSGRKVPIGIGTWRGSQLYTTPEMGGFRFLPTYHPAAIFRTWPWRYDIVHDLKSRVPKALKDAWDPPNYDFLISPSFEDVMKRLCFFWEEAEKGPFLLSEDIETSNEHITCIGYAWNNLDAICIPFAKYGGHEHYWSEAAEKEIVIAIRRLHAHPNIKVVGMNFLYDALHISLYWGYMSHCHADVMFLHHLCWPSKPKSLNYISSLYNNYHRYWKDEGKVWHPTFSDEQHWAYCCTDCVTTFEANTHLQKVVDFLNLREQATTQMAQFPIALDMMVRGVLIDQEARAVLSEELKVLMVSVGHRCLGIERASNKVIPYESNRYVWPSYP